MQDPKRKLLSQLLAATALRPADDYDVQAWKDYYAKHPGVMRAVGADATELNLEDPAVKKLLEPLITAAVKDATSKLEKNRDTIKGEKIELQKKLDALTEQLGDIDVGSLKEFVARSKNDEYTKLIKEGKFQQVIDAEVQKAVAKVQRDIEAANERAKKAEEAAVQAKNSFKQEKIRNKAALSVKDFQDGALDDIQRRALETFDYNDEGQFVLKEGVTARLKNGKPVDFDSFGQYLIESAPYYFKPSNGGGGDGGKAPAKGQDGLIRILAADQQAINKHQKDIATGKAIVVDAL